MNPLENYSEEDIFNRFRFRLPTIMYIMNTIEHSINHNSKKNCALPPNFATVNLSEVSGYWSFSQTSWGQHWDFGNDDWKMLSLSL